MSSLQPICRGEVTVTVEVLRPLKVVWPRIRYLYWPLTIMSTSTWEYLTVIRATSKLAAAVKNNITPLSLKLVEKFLITREQQEAVRNRRLNVDDRAADLVAYIQDKVKQDAKNYHIFVGILEEDKRTYKEILNELKPPSDGVSCGQGAQHSASTQPSGITISPSRDCHSCVPCASPVTVCNSDRKQFDCCHIYVLQD